MGVVNPKDGAIKPRTVVLYGSNLIMSSIGASLQQKPEFKVLKVEDLLPETLEKLKAGPPDAILFDLGAAQPHFAIPLLREHPSITLIGVDLAVNKMLVLSGQQSRLLLVDDLLKVITGGGSR